MAITKQYPPTATKMWPSLARLRQAEAMAAPVGGHPPAPSTPTEPNTPSTRPTAVN